MNIYEIDQEILECVDAETGEIVDAERLDQLQMQRDKKIENIACWIKNLTAEAVALRAEANALLERAQSAERRVKSLKGYILHVNGEKKFESTRVKFWFTHTKQVEADVDKIPDKYKVIDVTPDKRAIKEALLKGEDIEGAILVMNTNIVIK